MTDTALAGASSDQAAAGRAKRPTSRPAAKPHGQWKVDGTAPLNANETWKQEDNGLNVRERIESVYSKHGFDSIDGTDLHGRFRWWGLYTQRKPGIDGGKTATLEPHELATIVEGFKLLPEAGWAKEESITRSEAAEFLMRLKAVFDKYLPA